MNKLARIGNKSITKLAKRFGKLQKYKKFNRKEVKEEKIQTSIVVNQYPKNLDDTSEQILRVEYSPELMTVKNEVSLNFHESKQHQRKINNDLEDNTKILTSILVGMPNSGKSTLINKLFDQEIASVSKLSHTTAENTQYAKTDLESKTQLTFYDTPGLIPRYSKELKGFDRNQALQIMDEGDLAILVVDCNRRLDEGLIEILNTLRRKKISAASQMAKHKLRNGTVENMNFMEEQLRVVLVLNKVDLCTNKRRLLQIKEEIEDFIHFEKVFMTSGITGYGVSMLEDYLRQNAVKGAWEMNSEQISLSTEYSIIVELARSCVYECYFKEIPHKTEVEILKLELMSDGVAKIGVTLVVKGRIQKAMVIGKEGKNLKRFNKLFCRKFASRFGFQCELDIHIGHRKIRRTFEGLDYVTDEEHQLKTDIKKYEEERKKKLHELKKGQAQSEQKNIQDEKHREKMMEDLLKEFESSISESDLEAIRNAKEDL